MRLQFFLTHLAFCLSACHELSHPGHNDTKTIAGIAVPFSPLITKALAYIRANTDVPTYNHLLRTWLNGMASISNLPSSVTQDFDLEAISIATLMHDIGWSNNGALISNTTRFEVNGADLTRKFILREGDPAEWDKHRIQLVWDAIALHGEVDINPYKEAEVAFTALSVYEDVLGPNTTAAQYGAEKVGVTQAEWAAFNEAYPRLGLKTYINGRLTWLCQTKPWTTYTNFVGDWGQEAVDGYDRTGKRLIDVLEANIIE